MKFHRRKSPGLTRLDKLMTHLSPPLLILPVICAVSLVTTARATTVLEPLPEPSTTLFGFAVASLGDVNGDSVPDYAVGAPFQDGDFVSTAMGFGLPQNVGKVFVINGATFAVLNVMNDPEFEVIQDQHFGGQLGYSLSVSADINNDGVADVIAGVPHHIANPNDQNAKTINAGKALVFSGKDGALLFTLNDPEEQEDGRFGTAVAALGDVNSDGVADFVIGVPGHDEGDEEDGISNVGIAYVFSGKTGALLTTLDDPSGTAGAAFGSAVANAGDVNNDRVSDIIVGAPGEAKAHVFSGKTGALLYSIASPKTELLTSFGAVVAGGQDFNKDKKPDVLVGAPLQAGNRGAVYVYNGINGAFIRSLKAPASQAFAQFGAAISASPDLTGDRRADIIVGAPGQIVNGVLGAGQAFVFDGVRGQLKTTLTSATPQAHAGFGSAVTSVLFGGSRVSTPVVGVPYQDTVTGSGQTAVTHLQAGQIEISQ
jgi:FG-GAP repeat